MITREAAGTLLTHAGPEIGVASTKAFTCQLTALFCWRCYLGQSARGDDDPNRRAPGAGVLRMPGKLETVLADDADYEELAADSVQRHRFSFPRPRHSLSRSRSKAR